MGSTRVGFLLLLFVCFVLFFLGGDIFNYKMEFNKTLFWKSLCSIVDLFHQVIMMSGSDRSQWAVVPDIEDAKYYATELAREIGCPPNDNYRMIKCLQEHRTADEIVNASARIRVKVSRWFNYKPQNKIWKYFIGVTLRLVSWFTSESLLTKPFPQFLMNGRGIWYTSTPSVAVHDRILCMCLCYGVTCPCHGLDMCYRMFGRFMSTVFACNFSLFVYACVCKL